MSDEIKVAKSCGYRGFEFGARYLDAVCLDGFLWDEDSCDAPGDSVLCSGGDIPCPNCHPSGYRRYCKCSEAERRRRVLRAFGETPWIPSDGTPEEPAEPEKRPLK